MHGEGLRCRDLFELEPLKGSLLLAGKGGLDRVIDRVNVMEVPDVTDWVRPGEFLITTGYPFRNDPELFADMLPKLAEKGIAAIGIKTKRFVDEIPPSVLKLGDELNLCVLELPPNTVFSDVVSHVMEHVLNGRLFQMNVLQERVGSATQILMDGGGMQDILSCAESFVRNPVILLNSRDECLCTEETEKTHDSDIRSMDWRWIRHQAKGSPYIWNHAGREWHAWPMSNQKSNPAWLIAIEDSSLTRLDRLTLEKIGAIAGLELMNLNVQQRIEYKYRDQFLQDWLTGRIGAESDLQLRAEVCGAAVDVRSESHCAAILLGDGRSSARDQELLLSLRNSKMQDQVPFEVTLLQDQLIFVLQRREYAQDLIPHLQALLEGDRFCLCLGKIAADPTSLFDSYAEARRIAAISSMSGITAEILTYDTLGVYPLLLQLAGSDELPKFLDKFITPLKEHDLKQESNLLATLQNYFHYGRNAKAAAVKMFAHYNTVLYRLERISGILGLDINHPDSCFQLELALKLHDLMTLKTVKKESEGGVFA
jgi:purine catabolism regulator